MSEREKDMAADIMDIFEQLPEEKKHQLLGVAQGMDIATDGKREWKKAE